MRLDPAVVQLAISNLLVQFPELAEDDQLRADMIEGETEAFDFLSEIVKRIGEAKVLVVGIEEYRKELDERHGRFERRCEALRALAFKVMQAADLRKAELPEATLSVRNGSPRVIITDESALPDDMFRVTRVPDKTKLKECLQGVGSIPGAELSNAEPSLSIRIK